MERQAHGALLLDVREPYEFLSGHAPGALNIPLGELAARHDALDPDRELLVVCASGGRPALALQLLRRDGYASAWSVADGVRI